MNKKTIIFILLILVVIAGIFYFVTAQNKQTSPAEETSVVYKNDLYGFTFTMPLGWKNYSVTMTEWNGFDVASGKQTEKGPQLAFRDNTPVNFGGQQVFQEIPIMVFTLKQWDLVSSEKIAVGAAPIGPSELGRNANYVFALPARYNFYDKSATKEVGDIVASHPLKTF